MRYTVYSGEPIIVGGLRTWPGPGCWVACYAMLDIASIWPYNASNAAVPLAAVVAGPPAPDGRRSVAGQGRWALGFSCWRSCPWSSAGTVYRMLERIMTAKLVLVLGYLSLIAVTLVSWPVIRDVCTGFVSFGTVPLRAPVDRSRAALHSARTAGHDGLSRQRHLGARRPADRRPVSLSRAIAPRGSTCGEREAHPPRSWPSATVCWPGPAISRRRGIFSSRPRPAMRS